jgi:lipopolysaccharide exporter
VVGFAASVALARLIPPGDFGHFAVVSVLFLLAGEAAGNGITASLVRLPVARTEHFESGTLIALAAGFGIGAGVVAMTPLVAPLFGDEVARLLRLGAPFVPLAAAAAASIAILQRRLAFKRIAILETAGVLAGLGASIALAVAGMDADALVLGAVVGQALMTVALLAAASPPLPALRRPEARELLRFGAPSAAAAIASVGARNVDYAVLAARASAAQVGFYWRGYQLGVELPRRFGGSILGQLALPLYAQAEDHAHRLDLRARIVRLHTLVAFPALALLIVLAPVLVPALFGERWEPAVAPTQILAGVGMLGAVESGAGGLLSALGHPRVLLGWNLTTLVVVGIAVYLAAPHGLTAVCLAVLGTRLVRQAAMYGLLSRYAAVPAARLWRDPAPALTATAAMAVVVVALQAAGLGSLPPAAEVSLLAVIAPLSYAGALRIAFPDALADLTGAVRRLARRSTAHHAPGASSP